MTTLTQFLGGKTSYAPLGGLREIMGATSANPTFDRQEYLKTSVLKPIAGYESFAASNPGAAGIVLTTAFAPGNVGALLWTNSRWYSITYSSATSYTSTDPTAGAWGSISTVGGFAADAFTFNNRVVVVHGAHIASVLNTAVTDTTVTSMTCGSVNAAGTLGMFAAGLENGSTSYTTTDGLNLTARVMAGGGGGNALYAGWSVAGNTFFIISSNGKAYSTTDGFNLTDRGAIAGATNVQASSIQHTRNECIARSSTSTLVICRLTVGGVAEHYLVRTTNGISYTATKLSALPGDAFLTLGGARITRIGSAYYIYGQSFRAGGDDGFWLVSNDDGVTWAKASAPYSPAVNVSYQNIGWNGTTTLFVASTTVAGVSSTFSPTHVGIAYPISMHMTTSNTPHPGSAPLYLRIK